MTAGRKVKSRIDSVIWRPILMKFTEWLLTMASWSSCFLQKTMCFPAYKDSSIRWVSSFSDHGSRTRWELKLLFRNSSGSLITSSPNSPAECPAPSSVCTVNSFICFRTDIARLLASSSRASAGPVGKLGVVLVVVEVVVVERGILFEPWLRR